MSAKFIFLLLILSTIYDSDNLVEMIIHVKKTLKTFCTVVESQIQPMGAVITMQAWP